MTKFLDDLKENVEKFFLSSGYLHPSRENLDYLENWNGFISLSRKNINDLMWDGPEARREVTGEENYNIDEELEEIIYIIDAHDDTDSNERNLITGHSGGALNKLGEERARSFFRSDLAPNLIVTSDLPRAIHHAIAKYHPEKLSELKDLIKNTPATLDQNYGIIDPDIQRGWISAAIDLAIIPTPLLRAQYYGVMELFPVCDIGSKIRAMGEKAKELPEKEIQRWIENYDSVCQPYFDIQKDRFIALGFEKYEAEERIEMIRQALLKRQDPQFNMEFYWKQMSEQRLDLVKRIGYFMDQISPANEDIFPGGVIQIVTHSGTLDAIYQYLERYEKPDDVHLIKRKKPSKRGESAKVNLSLKQISILKHDYASDGSFPRDVQIVKDAGEMKSIYGSCPNETYQISITKFENISD